MLFWIQVVYILQQKHTPPPPLRNPILSPSLDKIIEALFSFPFQIAKVYLPQFLVTFKKFRYNSIFSQLIFGHYTVPKGKLGAEMFLIFRRNIQSVIFRHLKFFSWCAKNDSNYNKYFSSNFSSLEQELWEQNISIPEKKNQLLFRAGQGEEQKRAGTTSLYASKCSGRAAAYDSECQWFKCHRCCFILPRLKGQCHKIFDLYFFHESNPSGPRINRLKWFFLKICIREDVLI